ncbi:Predicted methyltransferase, contains TPR repeat [Albimonas donghaensis]|uniref:Predicted methyltransferase, contains TPR repeat n=1 Tax=Albimonas donghaensis TaxID=356660 RepID=A0A1H2T3R5_9RHOB|nr:methyltransferase [Albimonas donghaensis]SDW38606.1 Predicted methyltransferase, contains TPR repeat [Albimonas donghaensis]
MTDDQPSPDPEAETETDPLTLAYDRALTREKAGDALGAAEAWREVLALDPADHGGAAVRLAALGAAADPDRASPAYVATLFDQHAASFEDILVGKLGYRAPERLAQLIEATGGRKDADGDDTLALLDLGCGTGLMAAALGPLAGHATGVDLSEEMLGEADERELYDELYVGDAVAFLHAPAEDEDGDVAGPWDLICAADVLPYLGALEDLFSGVFAQLHPGGRFAFSTETLSPAAFDGRPWRIGPHQRFHHSEAYIRDGLAAAGFEILVVEDWVIRTNLGDPEPGHLVVARRPA